MAGNKVKIDVVVDAKKGTKDVKKFGKDTEKSMKAASKGMSGLTKAALAGAAAFTAIVAIKIGSWVKNQISSWADYADNIIKTADNLGIATDSLQGLQFAAEISGVALGTFNKALAQMLANIGDAADGTGIAADSFAKMNINVQELMNMRPEDQMAAIAEGIMSLTTNAEQLYASRSIFGARGGTQMLNMLREGKEGVKALTDEAKKLGGVLGRDNLEAAARYNDAITRMTFAWRGFVSDIGPEAAKLLGWIAENMGDWIKQTKIMLGLGAAAKIDLYRGRIEQLWESIIELEVQQNKYNNVLKTSTGRQMTQAQILKAVQDATGLTIEQIKEEMRLTEERLKASGKTRIDLVAETKLSGDMLTIQKMRNELHAEELGLRKELLNYKKLIADLEKKEKPPKAAPGVAAPGKGVDQGKLDAEVAALAAMNNAKQIAISLIEDERTKARAAMEEKIELSKQEYEAKVEKHGQYVEFVLEQNTKELQARQEHAEAIDAMEADFWARQQERHQAREDMKTEGLAQEGARQTEIQAMMQARDERGFIDLETDLARTGRFYAEKIEMARQAGASEMQLAEIKKNFMKDAAMSGLQTVMQIAQQHAAESKNAWRVYKATAIAQTIISTFKSAQSSYEALAPIPVVGPYLGVAAAIAATIAGMQRVQKIRKQERPSAAEGGVFSGPRSGFPATLHGTEAVVPLPNGRAIPVEGGGGGTLNVNIQAVDSQSIVELMARNPQAVLGPMIEQMQLGDRNLISTIQNTTREE